MSLSNIVSVVITKETAVLTRVGFGTPLLLVSHEVTAKVAEEYASLSEMEDDGFASTDLAYQLAAAIFAQNPKVEKIVLGKRQNLPTRTVTITPKTPVQDSTLYRVTINGTNFDYTSDADATVAEITAGLTALIDAGTEDVNATDGTTDLEVEAADAPGGSATPGVPFTIELDRTLMDLHDDTADAGIAADLSAVRDVNDDWYCVTGDWYDENTADALATVIETLQRMHVWACQDTDILDSGVSDDAFSTLNASAYERSAGIWHSEPHDGPAAAWVGNLLPYDPGQATWKFKTLAGIAFDSFTSGEQTTLTNKKGNSYIRVAGLNMTQEGVAHQGEFLDTVRGLDFIAQRIAEDVYRVLKVAPKIPYTDQGVSSIQAAVDAVLQSATAEGGGSGQIFTDDPAPVVTVPLVADVDANTKAGRTFPDVDWTATLAGAVHKVEVAGKVAV